MKNTITYKVYGRYALFTDPVTKLGGEKCSYHIPTYEALKGITKSIYWKPSLIWHIDRVRVMKRIRTEAKNVKPIKYGGGNDLSIYTYLADVEYHVQAHFVFNQHRQDLKDDFHDGKHFNIALRMLEKGGRRDICLGSRECQGYVEPCDFGTGESYYDHSDEVAYGFMFHGFDYPDENGNEELWSRFSQPVMKNGIIDFHSVDDPNLVRKFIRKIIPNQPKSSGFNDPTLYEKGIQP